MTVLSANDVVHILQMNGLNSRIEHSKTYTWTSGCRQSDYLGPNIFKSLIKRGLIVKVGSRVSGEIEIYDLAERVS